MRGRWGRSAASRCSSRRTSPRARAASSRGDELTEPFAAENLRMGELAGAVAGVQLGRLPAILHALRANKLRILDAVGAMDGLTPRRVPDPIGDGSSSAM